MIGHIAKIQGVLDFVKAIGAKLIVSMSNCPGLHSAEEPWNPSGAEKLFFLSREYGVPINAAEFANEPNMVELAPGTCTFLVV